MPAQQRSTRRTGWHRAGPWPGWLRWYEEQRWPQRDARVWELYQTGLTTAQIAEREGCSKSTVSRGLKRHRQRIDRSWPPRISNGFGLSAQARRALRLRQNHYRDPDPGWQPRMTKAEREYVVPIADQYDDNGEPAW
jgi:hypothetical protein